MEASKNQTAPVVQLLSDTQPDPIVAVEGNFTYRGYAPLGTPLDAPAWMIKRVSTTGGVTITEYAGGNMRFEHRWDLRASLIYSR